jgi:hypothetical protein
MLTRRRLLLSVGGFVGLAGCSITQQTGGRGAVCAASFSGFGGQSGNTVFSITPQVTSFGAGDEPLVELILPVRRATIESEGVDRLVVSSGGDVLYRIPVTRDDETVGPTNRYEYDDVVEYSQSLGHLPQNGIYEVAALDSGGQELDRIGLEFRCYRQPNGEGS